MADRVAGLLQVEADEPVTTSGVGPTPSPRSLVTEMAARTRLFAVSYAPLFLILAVRFNSVQLRAACAALFIWGIGDAVLITTSARRHKMRSSVTLLRADDVGSEVSGYLASYLLPFVTVSTPNVQDVVGYTIFLIIAWLIYVRSDLVRVNPTFYILGYRVLKVQLADNRDDYLLTRGRPRPGDKVRVVDVAGLLLSAGASDAHG